MVPRRPGCRPHAAPEGPTEGSPLPFGRTMTFHNGGGGGGGRGGVLVLRTPPIGTLRTPRPPPPPSAPPSSRCPLHLPSPHVPAGAERCHNCGKPLSGTIMTALGKKWHPDCFKCGKCGLTIRTRPPPPPHRALVGLRMAPDPGRIVVCSFLSPGI